MINKSKLYCILEYFNMIKFKYNTGVLICRRLIKIILNTMKYYFNIINNNFIKMSKVK